MAYAIFIPPKEKKPISSYNFLVAATKPRIAQIPCNVESFGTKQANSLALGKR
jgi:hypothetical protein